MGRMVVFDLYLQRYRAKVHFVLFLQIEDIRKFDQYERIRESEI